MEDLYSIHPGIARATTASAGELSAMRAEEVVTAAATGITDLRKARIASHPLYPSLLSAYIDCRKVGAPPETVTVLETIARERHGGAAAAIGADPELDEFMDSYYRVLVRYKDELSKPFNDAVSFLATIESQLHNLCKASSVASSSSFAAAGGGAATADAVTSPSDEALGSSDEEPTYWDVDASESHDSLTQVFENYELKEILLKKYSVHLTSLRAEFLKKRKKGKLPKDARLTLLDWWNYHYQWPYPTEEEKAKLAELTGLDQKQINNWFINQRKRHWKPSEDMQSALEEGLCGGSRLTTLCFETGTIGP